MNPVTVHDVVAFLLTRSPGFLSMSVIHRMAYFAQGHHLAWTGTPLFNEELRIRRSGPVVHALFPVQENGCTAEAWPTGNASAVTGAAADTVTSVFDFYGDMSGISLGRIAHKHAPCTSAATRKNQEDPEPVIDLDDMKAFFKALIDAPEDRIAYANRFMSQYTDEALRVWP